MISQHTIYPLKGFIQHYDWGGMNFIPDLLGIKNKNQEPFAELWMGAHGRGPAQVQENGHSIALNSFIEQEPKSILGKKVIQQFGERLPYLFKVLDVRKMLSIQTHPTKKQAEAGFKKENEEGIPLDAAHRNFKDDNHKPEIMVAVTEFYLLHGFKSAAAIAQTLREVPEFSALEARFSDQNIYELYKFIMEMPQAEVNQLLAPIHQRLHQESPQDKTKPDYWAHLAFHDYTTKEGNFDRGIFSIYLFNVVQLQPGEGIFQDAGIPHAYLEGINMELMANSDNVFRGGLTPKYIDVPELLQHLVVEPVEPKILHGEQISESERVYRTPAPDFELSKIQLAENQTYRQAAKAPDSIIVLEGSVQAGEKKFQKGEIIFAPAGTEYTLKATESAVLFRATVPV